MALSIPFRFRTVVEDPNYRADLGHAFDLVDDKETFQALVRHIDWYLRRNAHNCPEIPRTKGLRVYVPKHHKRGFPDLAVYFVLSDPDTVKLCALKLEVQEE